MARQVVVGAGPDALRAAAVRATTGAPVLLLQAHPQVTGLQHPELPQSTGRMRDQADERRVLEQVLGALVEAPANGQGLLARGNQVWLPMKRRHAAKLIPPLRHLDSVRGWLDARKAARGSELVVGGGQEERSYRDWVVRRMGEPAFETLYQAYAEHRFGAPADELNVTVARYHHALRDDGPHQVPPGREHVALAEAEQCIRAAGGEIRTGVEIEGVDLVDGRAGALRLKGGERVELEGPLWVARPPRVVASWLPDDAVAAVAEDARRLKTADLLVTCLKGEVDGLPEVLHVLEAGSSFWQVVTPYGIKEYALFLSTLPTDAPDEDAAAVAQRVADDARRLGVGDFELEGARVERVRDHQAVWTVGCHARFHRVIDRLAELGIVAVGRTGTFSSMDAGEEIALAAAYRDLADPPQRDTLRRFADPPVRLDDLDASLRRFIER